MYVDSHVHCRDDEWRRKETIVHALRVAEDSGLSGIFDMPNTQPPVLTRERVLERIALAREANSKVFFGIYVGVSYDPNQIKEAVGCVREFFPRPGDRIGVVGLKMFAGESVGDLSVIDPDKQRLVYRTLADLKYEKVLAVHCEKESEMQPELWKPENPISHCCARPEKAEVESIKDQTRLAMSEGFACSQGESYGRLHIVHVTHPEALRTIDVHRHRSLNISCAATFHHLLLSAKVMNQKDGILYKVNPPLRHQLSKESLLNCFRAGLIEILESDHAPHTGKENFDEHMSGIPGLASWPRYLEILRKEGVSQELIEATAFGNVNEIFGTSIPKLEPPIKVEEHVKDYAFDPCKYLSARV